MPFRGEATAAAGGSFGGVPPSFLDEVWPQAEPLVARACARGPGGFLPSDIREAVLAGEMQLWVCRDRHVRGIVITEIVDYPRRRVCLIAFAAGDGIERWLGWLAVLEAWARDRGCDSIEAVGRRGWARLLKGYEQTVMLRKELGHVRHA